MGMTTYEYDNIFYCDLVAKIEGFKQRLDYQENIYRNMAFSSYISANLDPKKMAKKITAFWPIHSIDGGSPNQKKVSDEKRAAIKAELLKRQQNVSTSGN